MKTSRRDFLALATGAFSALLLRGKATSTPALPVVPKVQLDRTTIGGAKSKHVADLWKSKCDTQECRGIAGNLIGTVKYNDHEEFEGPIELLNVGGRFTDGICVIKEKTVEFQHGFQRVTVKAVRYPKIL